MHSIAGVWVDIPLWGINLDVTPNQPDWLLRLCPSKYLCFLVQYTANNHPQIIIPSKYPCFACMEDSLRAYIALYTFRK